MIALTSTERLLSLSLLAQVGLTIVVLCVLAWARVSAILGKRVLRTPRGEVRFPKWTTQVSDCFNNQFQMPTLFYVLVAMALLLHAATPPMMWQAPAFAGLRWLHAGVFITTNFVPARLLLFLVSSVLLAAMWFQLGRQMLGV